MRTPPLVASLMKKDANTAVAPIKVCMHVLGSTDSRILRDAVVLVEAGFDVSIVDFSGNRTQSVQEEIHGIHMRHIIMPGLFVPARFKPWFLVKLVIGIVRGIVCLLQMPTDIYHVHMEKALLACFIVARLKNKPFIVDTPELTMSDPSITRWPRLRSFAIWIITRMVSRCAGYITGSPLYPGELHKLYHISQVTVVRHVPYYQIVTKSDRLRQRLELGPQVRIALYQGNLQANRGLDMLIRAAPFLAQDIVIVMMGQGFKEIPALLRSLIESEGVGDRVKILPPVPYDELLEWTASADIGLTILPSDYSVSIQKCLPNKFFEYLMAGLPVLSSRLDAIAEMIDTYDVGQVVSSLAPGDIAQAINFMLANPDNLARMKRNALKIATSEFYWEKESEKLLDLYHKILDSQAEKFGMSHY